MITELKWMELASGQRKVQVHEQALVQHEVVAVAPTQGKVTHKDTIVRCVGKLYVGGLYSTTHIGECCQPRTRAVLLYVRLREGCRVGKTRAAESPVAIDVEHLHVGHALLEKQVGAVECHVSRKRLRSLVDDIDSIAVRIGIQVQLVVLVATTQTGRI